MVLGMLHLYIGGDPTGLKYLVANRSLDPYQTNCYMYKTETYFIVLMEECCN